MASAFQTERVGRGNKGCPGPLARKDAFGTFWVRLQWSSSTGMCRDARSTSSFGLSSFPITNLQLRLNFSLHMNPSIFDYYSGCMYNPIRFTHTSQGSGWPVTGSKFLQLKFQRNSLTFLKLTESFVPRWLPAPGNRVPGQPPHEESFLNWV